MNESDEESSGLDSESSSDKDKSAGDDNPKKQMKSGVKYKEEMEFNAIKSIDAPYRTYMAMFSEAMNCLDAIAALCIAQDPSSELVKSYQKSRSQIGLKIEKTKEGVKSAWTEIEKIAGPKGGGSGLTSVIPSAVKRNEAVRNFREEKKSLDAQLEGKEGRKIKREYYDQKLDELKKKYSAMIDPAQILSMTKINDAIGLYRSAIDKFSQGADIEISSIEKKEGLDTKEFYRRIADSMESLVLSRKYSEKNSKKFESVELSQGSILEDIGGFLHQNRPFIDGVAQGVKDIFKGNKETPLGPTDARSLYYSAENLKGAVISVSSEIDNVINYKRNVYGIGPGSKGDSATERSADKAAKEARESAGEMISFLRDSFKYLDNIKEEIKNNPPSEIKKRLDSIQKQLEIIGRNGGILEKWKDEVMGKEREEVASSSYLQKGRDLMKMASDEVAEVTKSSELKKQIRSREGDVLLKKVLNSIKGKPGETGSTKKPKRLGPKVFSKDSENPDKSLVSSYQERLIKIGKLPSGHSGGEYDKETQDATKRAMTYIGTVAGKVYNDSDEAFQDFQRDLGFYTDNKEEIRRVLGY